MKENKTEKSFLDELQTFGNQVLLPSPSSIPNQLKSNKKEEYKQLNDDGKLSFIETELLETVEKIDESLDALDTYERQTTKIPHGIYDLKNKFLENRRQVLKALFDIISHKQKLEKEQAKGDNIVEIIKN